jgi:hypothetical protein
VDPRDRLADAFRRPGAYGLRTFEQAVAFLVGFDAALDFELLKGFPEWLAEELGAAENLAWPVLADGLPDVDGRESHSWRVAASDIRIPVPGS